MFLDKLLPSPFDDRDYISSLPVVGLPNKIDMRLDASIEIENQLDTNSCIGNAGASFVELLLQRDSKFFPVSRLYLYYFARVESGFQNEDNGAYLRDVFESTNKYGVLPETDWPFNPNNINIEPPPHLIEKAKSISRCLKYEFCGTKTESSILQIKAQLANGKPVLISALVGESLENLKSFQGYVGVNNDLVGSHAMIIVGYDDSINSFIIENSWGKEFGENGYFAMTYDIFKTDVVDAIVGSEWTNITIIPNVEILSSGPKIYLNGDVNFSISSTCQVYGSEKFNSIVVQPGCKNTTVDNNVDEVAIPWLTNIDIKHVGNQLEVWEPNGVKLFTVENPTKRLQISTNTFSEYLSRK